MQTTDAITCFRRGRGAPVVASSILRDVLWCDVMWCDCLAMLGASACTVLASQCGRQWRISFAQPLATGALQAWCISELTVSCQDWRLTWHWDIELCGILNEWKVMWCDVMWCDVMCRTAVLTQGRHCRGRPVWPACRGGSFERVGAVALVLALQSTSWIIIICHNIDYDVVYHMIVCHIIICYNILHYPILDRTCYCKTGLWMRTTVASSRPWRSRSDRG